MVRASTRRQREDIGQRSSFDTQYSPQYRISIRKTKANTMMYCNGSSEHLQAKRMHWAKIILRHSIQSTISHQSSRPKANTTMLCNGSSEHLQAKRMHWAMIIRRHSIQLNACAFL